MKKTEEPDKKEEKKKKETEKKKLCPLLNLLLMKFTNISLFPDTESWPVAGRKWRRSVLTLSLRGEILPV